MPSNDNIINETSIMGYTDLCPYGQPNNNVFFFPKWNCHFDAQLAMLVHTVHYKGRLISETS